MLDRWPKTGVDLVCTQLYHQIRTIKTSQTDAAKADRLIVQVDNASGENKNKYLMCLMSMFVYFGWYRCTELHFLMVGHTHNQIDAMFAGTNKNKYSQTVITPRDLFHQLTEENYKNPPTSVYMEDIYNWSEMMVSKTIVLPELFGHTGPHHFLFVGHKI